jgi:hypothetical protein
VERQLTEAFKGGSENNTMNAEYILSLTNLQPLLTFRPLHVKHTRQNVFAQTTDAVTSTDTPRYMSDVITDAMSRPSLCNISN